jgi:hypothetical protein
MKKNTISIALIIFTILILSANQLIIHRTDGTQVNFYLDEIESITFGSGNGYEEYGMYIYSYGAWERNSNRELYLILIESYNWNIPITYIELNINGQPINLSGEWDYFWGEADLNQGDTITYDLRINDSNYNNAITLPYRPQNVTFPAFYDPTQTYNITWSLTGDSQQQFFEGWACSESECYFTGTTLAPWDRSFSIPSYWLPPNFPEYGLGLYEMNMNYDGNLAVYSAEGYGVYYGYDWRTDRTKIRETLKRLVKKINK